MTEWLHLHLFWTKFTLDVLCKSYIHVYFKNQIYIPLREEYFFCFGFIIKLTHLMSGLSFWYFFFFILTCACTSHRFSFSECWVFVAMFSLFSCCCIDSFMNWSIFVKCGIKHVNKCVRVHLTTGGYFYSFMSLIFFNYPLFLLQFHHFFHFF